MGPYYSGDRPHMQGRFYGKPKKPRADIEAALRNTEAEVSAIIEADKTAKAIKAAREAAEAARVEKEAARRRDAASRPPCFGRGAVMGAVGASVGAPHPPPPSPPKNTDVRIRDDPGYAVVRYIERGDDVVNNSTTMGPIGGGDDDDDGGSDSASDSNDDSDDSSDDDIYVTDGDGTGDSDDSASKLGAAAPRF